MAKVAINGITFNGEEVTSYNDALQYDFKYCKLSENYNLNRYMTLPYLNKLKVVVSGLSMTVQTGIGVIYGRHFEVEIPVEIGVASGDVGTLCVVVDISDSNNPDISIQDISGSLTQDDLTGTGVIFQMPLGTFDAAGGIITFTPDTGGTQTLDHVGDELTDDFVTVNGNQIIRGIKTFTQTLTTYAINMSGRQLNTQNGNITTGTGSITTASFTSNGLVKSSGGFNNGGVDIGTYVNSTGDVVTQGTLRGKLARLTGLKGEGTAIDITAGFSTLSQSFNVIRAYYGNGNLLYRAGRNGDASGNARYVHMSIYGTSGDTDASLRAYASTDNGVRHVTSSGSLKLQYVSSSAEQSLIDMNILKTSIQLDIVQLEEELENQVASPTKYSKTQSLISNKNILLNSVENRIEYYNNLLGG